MRLRNLVGMGLGALKFKLSGVKIPLNVMLSVTDKCPSRCQYCNIPARGKEELSLTNIIRLFHELRALGTQRIGIWGGEPLIREDIGEIIKEAKRLGFYTTMDTNGYFVPERLKEAALLDHIVLAFDGPKEVHDLNREPGSFKRVMEAMKVLQGKLPVWTLTVITKNNINAAPYILEICRKFGFMATFQVLHHNDYLGRGMQNLLPNDEDVKKVMRFLIEQKLKGQPIACTSLYLRHMLEWHEFAVTTSPQSSRGKKCLAGKLYFNVDTDGTIFPCSLLIEKVKGLNFLEHGVHKAINSAEHGECMSCVATCFTEYNYLYSLNIKAIFEWLGAMKKTRISQPPVIIQ